jgi:hypothetical protein
MNVVGGRVFRKPFYRLDEVCERWGMSADDLAAFVLAGELTLSIPAAGMWLDVGELLEVEGSGYVRSPHGTVAMRGPVDLAPSDAWWVLRKGTMDVTAFAAEAGRYMEVHKGGEPFPSHEVVRADLIVRYAEMQRFEDLHSLAPAPVAIVQPSTEATAVPLTHARGALPRYDWDAFWSEVLVTTALDGPPASLADFVRRMEAWFAERGQYPDSSTIKKKLADPWRRMAPHLKRSGT